DAAKSITASGGSDPCDERAEMVNSGRIVRWIGACALWVMVGLGAVPTEAQANTYADSCNACHSTPPDEPSQDSTFGKIMSDLGQFADQCASNSNCVLRQLLAGTDSNGNVVNPTARANMLTYAQNFSNAELEAVRLYLQQVRNGAVSGSDYVFPGTTATGSSTTMSQTFTFSNYRGTSVGYTFSITPAVSDFTITTAPSAGSCAASTTMSPGPACSKSITIKFAPSGAGPSAATLTVAFQTPGDPAPPSQTFTLS